MAAAYTFPEWINRLTIEPAVKLLVQYFIGDTPPSSGGGSGGVVLSGVQETRSVTKNNVSDATYTIPAGALSYLIILSSDFVGTWLGVAVSGADTTSIPDNASPGNTLPAIAITRSAGTYSVIEGRTP